MRSNASWVMVNNPNPGEKKKSLEFHYFYFKELIAPRVTYVVLSHYIYFDVFTLNVNNIKI